MIYKSLSLRGVYRVDSAVKSLGGTQLPGSSLWSVVPSVLAIPLTSKSYALVCCLQKTDNVLRIQREVIAIDRL